MNMHPPALHKLWPKKANRNLDHELRNTNCYYIPRPIYAMINKFPLYNFPKLCNTYQGTSKLQPNRFTFLKSLKNELHSDIIKPPPTFPSPRTMPGPCPSGQPWLNSLVPLVPRSGPVVPSPHPPLVQLVRPGSLNLTEL